MIKKVGIVTFHCSYNYGSVLQAFALQTFLNENGWNATIIDYRSKDFDLYRIIPKRCSRSEIVRFLRVIAFLPKYLKRKSSFAGFWRQHLKLTPKTYTDAGELTEINKDYDAFICGSDQIWNMDCTDGVDPVFFLKFADCDKKKIAYGPSLGKPAFTRDYSDALREAINGLNAISVREKSTVSVIQPLTNLPISVVADPTLLVDIEKYPQRKPKHLKAGQKYIFAYMLRFDPQLISYCNMLSKKTGLPIFYIMGKEWLKGRSSMQGKDVFGATPDEFLYYISHADYVITNSFHATLFSVMYGTKLCVFHDKTTGARTRDFLSNVGLESLGYSDPYDINQEYNEEYVKVQLGKMQKQSSAYLLSSLTEQ